MKIQFETLQFCVCKLRFEPLWMYRQQSEHEQLQKEYSECLEFTLDNLYRLFPDPTDALKNPVYRLAVKVCLLIF